jgi:hypothetical protein
VATDHIQGIIGPLKEKRALVKAEVDEAMRKVTDLRVELSRIDRVLKAAGDDSKKEAKPTKASKNAQRKSRAGQSTKVATWRNEAVKEAVEKAEAPVTVREVASTLGWMDKTATVAVKQARDAGLIRLIGRGPGKGAGMLYGSTEKTYEQVGAAMNGNGDEASDG